MKIHGAASMAILVLVGMLLTGHVRFAWRARRNRGNGSLFLGAFGILTITGYGLYYAGGESLRAWTSWISSSHRIGAAVIFDPSHLVWETDKASPSATKTSRPGGEIDIAWRANFELRTGA